MSYKIGIDISSGDNAPRQIFEGVMLARKEIDEEIVLVGVKKEIEEEAARHRVNLSSLDIVEAPEKISMEESPIVAVRKKRNSSISIGASLIKEKKLDAFVSCGNTGALVCAATLLTGMLEGVERPGIAIPMPTLKNPSLVVDVGANIDCKPIHLLQYAVMATVYYKLVMGKDNPTVGILNIGEEESKGTELYKITHKLLAASTLNFIGNVEAKNIFSGDCDCIVCDGVMGNIALKVSEGFAKFFAKSFSSAARKNIFGILGGLLMRGNLREFKKRIDSAEYGGAPLFGINGIVIKAHGSSGKVAVKNALKVASKELKQQLNVHIKEKIDEICQNSGVRQILTA